MLVVLYILAGIWFYMAFMVALRVVRGLGAEDSRSDDEGEEEEVELLEKVPQVNGLMGESTARENNSDLRKRK